jgi:hypothetical protein
MITETMVPSYVAQLKKTTKLGSKRNLFLLPKSQLKLNARNPKSFNIQAI